MRPLYRRFLALVAIVMLAGATAAHSETFSYQTIDYPGAEATYAYGINNAGEIVGYYNSNGTMHGFLLSDGVYTTIDPPGSVYTEAYGINDAGLISGYWTTGAYSGPGFLFDGQDYTYIYYPGARGTVPYSSNETGEIVGGYCTYYS